ncbi:hypothetical protein SAMN05216316_0023 [Nitrosovibrio sp. Nv6]|nr:hypothetical protein SAMN05216316_0023 [Nitrosovibrio sp. Nv6]
MATTFAGAARTSYLRSTKVDGQIFEKQMLDVAPYSILTSEATEVHCLGVGVAGRVRRCRWTWI